MRIEMGFTGFGPNDHSLTTAETHEYISYFERPPVSGSPGDTWDALDGNQTGRVDIQAYMGWLCANGYFSEGSSQCSP